MHWQAGIKQGFVQGGSMGFTWFVMFAMFGVAFWYAPRPPLDLAACALL